MGMKKILLIMMLAQILVIFSTAEMSQGVEAQDEPSISIDKMVFPQKVLPSQNFVMSISVKYSCKQKTMCNIGIYNFSSDSIIDPIMFYLEGNGSRLFLFNVRAPGMEGELKFEALLRYWHLGRWLYENESLHKTFFIKPTDKISLGIIMPIANLIIKFDSAEIRTDNYGVAKFNVKIGSHMIEAPQKFYLKNNTRLVFLKWIDGSRSNPRVVEIQGDMNLTAEYETEYYLSIRSSLGEAQGEGWYPSGHTAVFSAPKSILGSVYGFITEKYTFRNWNGDSDAATPIAKIEMSGPKTVEAHYQTEQRSANLITVSSLIMIFDTAILAYIMLRRSRRLG